MGTEFGGRSSLLFFVGVLSVLLLQDWDGASASLIDMNSSCSSSSSSKGDCTLHDIEDEDGEFFMDSEVHRRILAGAPRNKISYAAVDNGNHQVCDARKINNCIKPMNRYTRPCAVYNRCKDRGKPSL